MAVGHERPGAVRLDHRWLVPGLARVPMGSARGEVGRQRTSLLPLRNLDALEALGRPSPTRPTTLNPRDQGLSWPLHPSPDFRPHENSPNFSHIWVVKVGTLTDV